MKRADFEDTRKPMEYAKTRMKLGNGVVGPRSRRWSNWNAKKNQSDPRQSGQLVHLTLTRPAIVDGGQS
jgi:hypothetical protein